MHEDILKDCGMQYWEETTNASRMIGCKLFLPGVGSGRGLVDPKIAVLLQETFVQLSSFQMAPPPQEALDQLRKRRRNQVNNCTTEHGHRCHLIRSIQVYAFTDKSHMQSLIKLPTVHVN